MAILDRVERRGDMHHERYLKIVVQSDGDVILAIMEDGSVIEERELGKETRRAQVEFCASGGGRSHRTRAALMDLVLAMKADNEENPRPSRKHT